MYTRIHCKVRMVNFDARAFDLHIKFIKNTNVCLCIRVLAVLLAYVAPADRLIKTPFDRV